MKYEVEKYLIKSQKKYSKKYTLKIAGLELYFDTLKGAEKYYQQYIK